MKYRINIYIARLIIEHPREWLASLADYHRCVQAHFRKTDYNILDKPTILNLLKKCNNLGTDRLAESPFSLVSELSSQPRYFHPVRR